MKTFEIQGNLCPKQLTLFYCLTISIDNVKNLWIWAVVFITSGLFLKAGESVAQARQSAFELNQRLGRGVNFGNGFEAPAEEAWGNPWQPDYFKIIRDLGFNHIRLPVRWEPEARSLASPPYTINQTFLERIRSVVDAALENKLHIIINMHHHETMMADPSAERGRFLSQWTQIATYFRDYPDSLLFEVLNEPHGKITPLLWNELFADALKEIRKTNPTRGVLMGLAEYGGLSAVPQVRLPDDDNIILTPHYYNPFTFTHQGADWVGGSADWIGTKWLDTEAEREAIKSEFRYLLHFSEKNNVPVHIGEFGAFSRADSVSRKKWTNFLSRWLEEENLSWAYWEFSAGFGIYDPVKKKYHSFLVDALLKNEMPPPVATSSKAVYVSDFSSSNDGWKAVAWAGAAGQLHVDAGQLHVAVDKVGTEGWHFQVDKNNLLLEKDKTYKLSFTGSAKHDKSISFYAAMSRAPWSMYGYSATFTLTPELSVYTLVWKMQQPTDAAARLVFDAGRDTTDFVISRVTVEELSLEDEVLSLEEQAKSSGIILYPNPVSNSVKSGQIGNFKKAVIMDGRGFPVSEVQITPTADSLDFAPMLPGLYFVQLLGEGRKVVVKVLKR